MAMLWKSVFKALRPSYPEGRPFTSWHRLAVALAAAAPVVLVGAPSIVYLHSLLNRSAVEHRQSFNRPGEFLKLHRRLKCAAALIF